MLKTIEQKKKYIQATRLQNYRASLKLEGLSPSATTPTLSKDQILQKYKNKSVVVVKFNCDSLCLSPSIFC